MCFLQGFLIECWNDLYRWKSSQSISQYQIISLIITIIEFHQIENNKFRKSYFIRFDQIIGLYWVILLWSFIGLLDYINLSTLISSKKLHGLRTLQRAKFYQIDLDILDFKVESLLQIKQVMLSAEEAALMLGHQVILASSEFKAEYLSSNICQKYLLS